MLETGRRARIGASRGGRSHPWGRCPGLLLRARKATPAPCSVPPAGEADRGLGVPTSALLSPASFSLGVGDPVQEFKCRAGACPKISPRSRWPECHPAPAVCGRTPGSALGFKDVRFPLTGPPGLASAPGCGRMLLDTDCRPPLSGLLTSPSLSHPSSTYGLSL